MSANFVLTFCSSCIRIGNEGDYKQMIAENRKKGVLIDYGKVR